MERIKELKSVLQSGGTLSKSDKSYIKKEYFKVQGTELVTKSGCANCWMDAVIIIESSIPKTTIQMKGGALVYLNGIRYHKLNITDSIARQIMSEQPEVAHYFYNFK